MNKQDLIAIRQAVLPDKNFILATMLRALYYGDTWFSLIPKDTFMKHYHSIAEKLVATNNIKIACLRDEPTVIIGYSISTLDTVHFVYVKKSWRGIGIAKSLIPDNTNTVTHLTKVGLVITKKKNWIFNPFKM